MDSGIAASGGPSANCERGYDSTMTSLPRESVGQLADELEKLGLKKRLIRLGISGSRGFGMETPESDYDVKGYYSLDERELLGISTPKTQHQLALPGNVNVNVRDIGVLAKLIAKGNGNALEDVLCDELYEDYILGPHFRSAALACVSRAFGTHYLGYMHNEWKLVLRKDENIKPVMHMLRNALQGINMMRNGTLVMDVASLANAYNCGLFHDVVDCRRKGATRLTTIQEDRLRSEHTRLSLLLAEEMEHSKLPQDITTAAYNELEDVVIEVRKYGLV